MIVISPRGHDPKKVVEALLEDENDYLLSRLKLRGYRLRWDAPNGVPYWWVKTTKIGGGWGPYKEKATIWPEGSKELALLRSRAQGPVQVEAVYET